MDPGLREAEVVRLLEGLQAAGPSVLIGGYAIAAYGPPRFSVDVDLALPGPSLEQIRRWLRDQGYSTKLTLGASSVSEASRKLLATRGGVSADLFFGGVRARESGVEISYTWLSDRYRVKRLVLRTLVTSYSVRVVRPEALWVLKLVAGRSQDLSDLFAIRREPLDDHEVSVMMTSIGGSGHRTHLDGVSRRLNSTTLYHDSLSRWGLGSPSLVSNQQAWSEFRDRALAMLSYRTTK